jgi:hypothetical protein
VIFAKAAGRRGPSLEASARDNIEHTRMKVRRLNRRRSPGFALPIRHPPFHPTNSRVEAISR